MTAALEILKAGPGLTIQDQGRSGFLAYGLSRGGAMDRLALFEGAALLGQSAELAAIEMAGLGGEFRTDQDIWIALTGASSTWPPREPRNARSEKVKTPPSSATMRYPSP